MLEKTLKQDDLLMKTLDVKVIQRLICYTDKGMLALQIRKGENKYHLTLDSVPVEKELNKTLMDLLFPIPKLVYIPELTPIEMQYEMEIPQVKKDLVAETTQKYTEKHINPKVIDVVLGKKRIGRPKGAKTGFKMD